MSKSIIGQIFRHEGKIFQILSESKTLITAHSYDENCDIDTTLIISKEKGNVVGTVCKSKKRKRD